MSRNIDVIAESTVLAHFHNLLQTLTVRDFERAVDVSESPPENLASVSKFVNEQLDRRRALAQRNEVKQ